MDAGHEVFKAEPDGSCWVAATIIATHGVDRPPGTYLNRLYRWLE